MAAAPNRQSQQSILFATLASIVIVVPQVSKAFHVDDTVFVRQAVYLTEDPFGPYTFEINWDSHRDVSLVNNFNPPLLGYYLAPFVAIVGPREWVLHLANGVFVWLAAYWMIAFFREFSTRPMLAASLVLTSPIFVPTLNCMADIPHFALGLGGLLGFHRACVRADGPSARWPWGSALLLALCVSTKYAGALFVGWTGLLALVYRPKYLLVLVLPVLSIAAVAGQQWMTFGSTHFLTSQHAKQLPSIRETMAANVLLLGASLPAVAVLLPWMTSARRVVAILGAMVGIAIGWSWIQWGSFASAKVAYEHNVVWYYVAFALGGMCLALAVERPKACLWLSLWVATGFVFAGIYPVFPAARRLLPMLPPIVLLAIGDATMKPSRRVPSKVVVVGIFLQGLFAIWVALSDFEYAGVYRSFVAKRAPAWSGTDVWFLGHHGWQWYAEHAGWRAFDVGVSEPRPGDLLVVPAFVHKQDVYLQPLAEGRLALVGSAAGENTPRRAGVLTLVEREAVQANQPMRTGHPPLAIQLYGAVFPYCIAREPPMEVFEVYRFEAFP